MKAEPRVPSGAQGWGAHHPPLPATEGRLCVRSSGADPGICPASEDIPVVPATACVQAHTHAFGVLCVTTDGSGDGGPGRGCLCVDGGVTAHAAVLSVRL